ncbi:hypothetical protein GALL_408530 [mine drainage metagenome]|uniref:Uncharacterized protein n=1 Tax=mine drainage metagenome TaxID=410659 RepID=A0A1J5QIX5_9ZZZZ
MDSGQRGFSRFELALVIAVFVVVAGFFAHRFLYLQEYAEKTVMEMTLMNVRAGLRYKVAGLMMENRERELPALLQDNPVDWLEKPPSNYLGEILHPERQEITPGNWYFDASRRQLAYRLNLSAHFSGAREGDAELRFKTIALTQAGKQWSIGTPVVVGVKLVAVSDARWF